MHILCRKNFYSINELTQFTVTKSTFHHTLICWVRIHIQYIIFFFATLTICKYVACQYAYTKILLKWTSLSFFNLLEIQHMQIRIQLLITSTTLYHVEIMGIIITNPIILSIRHVDLALTHEQYLSSFRKLNYYSEMDTFWIIINNARTKVLPPQG